MIFPWELKTKDICLIRDKHSDEKRKMFQVYPNNQCLISLCKIKTCHLLYHTLLHSNYTKQNHMRKNVFLLCYTWENWCSTRARIQVHLYLTVTWCYAAPWMCKLNISNFLYHLVNNSNKKLIFILYLLCIQLFARCITYIIWYSQQLFALISVLWNIETDTWSYKVINWWSQDLNPCGVILVPKFLTLDKGAQVKFKSNGELHFCYWHS